MSLMIILREELYGAIKHLEFMNLKCYDADIVTKKYEWHVVLKRKKML